MPDGAADAAGYARAVSTASTVRRLLTALVGAAVRASSTSTPSRRTRPRAGGRTPAPAGRGRAPGPGGRDAGGGATGYAGDHTGPWRGAYAPDLDGEPDPGEVVWTWVPYEEDHSRGKDRPVLVVARDGGLLLALMLSSRDHDGGSHRSGERWLDLGPGPWDSRGRPSEVRLDRVLRIDPDAVRREGAVLDRARFDEVVRAAQR